MLGWVSQRLKGHAKLNCDHRLCWHPVEKKVLIQCQPSLRALPAVRLRTCYLSHDSEVSHVSETLKWSEVFGPTIYLWNQQVTFKNGRVLQLQAIKQALVTFGNLIQGFLSTCRNRKNKTSKHISKQYSFCRNADDITPCLFFLGSLFAIYSVGIGHWALQFS